ncbi:MAG: DUF4296 domain-containing protein [Chitinophagaceae bacterium]
MLISIFFISCKESVPRGIIKPQKMQRILWDVFRADALSQQIAKNDSTKLSPDENARLTRKVFLIHDITEEQFEKSYSYYIHHPDIIRTMLDSLNAQQTKINIIEDSLKREKQKSDSAKINN